MRPRAQRRPPHHRSGARRWPSASGAAGVPTSRGAVAAHRGATLEQYESADHSPPSYVPGSAFTSTVRVRAAAFPALSVTVYFPGRTSGDWPLHTV
jgi:hypothetical protein